MLLGNLSAGEGPLSSGGAGKDWECNCTVVHLGNLSAGEDTPTGDSFRDFLTGAAALEAWYG